MRMAPLGAGEHPGRFEEASPQPLADPIKAETGAEPEQRAGIAGDGLTAMADRRIADRRRTTIAANGDEVPEAAPVLRRADSGAETRGTHRGLPLPVRHVQRGVGCD